jgi:hypothetical protein
MYKRVLNGLCKNGNMVHKILTLEECVQFYDVRDDVIKMRKVVCEIADGKFSRAAGLMQLINQLLDLGV